MNEDSKLMICPCNGFNDYCRTCFGIGIYEQNDENKKRSYLIDVDVKRTLSEKHRLSLKEKYSSNTHKYKLKIIDERLFTLQWHCPYCESSFNSRLKFNKHIEFEHEFQCLEREDRIYSATIKQFGISSRFRKIKYFIIISIMDICGTGLCQVKKNRFNYFLNKYKIGEKVNCKVVRKLKVQTYSIAIIES